MARIVVLKKGTQRVRVFECWDCGCVWASPSEDVYYIRSEKMLSSACPCCGREIGYDPYTEDKYRSSDIWREKIEKAKEEIKTSFESKTEHPTFDLF